MPAILDFRIRSERGVHPACQSIWLVLFNQTNETNQITVFLFWRTFQRAVSVCLRKNRLECGSQRLGPQVEQAWSRR